MPSTQFSASRVLMNKNKLLGQYEGCVGVKIGYTKQTGRCFVASAVRDGMQLISVVLNCPDWFTYSAELLDACYETYSLYSPVAPFTRLEAQIGKSSRMAVLCPERLNLPLNQTERELVRVVCDIKTVPPGLKAGDIASEYVVYLGSEEAARANIVYLGEVPRASILDAIRKVSGRFLCRSETAGR